MRWMKRIASALAVLVLLLGVYLLFALAPSAVPATSSYELDLAQVRKLAHQGSGPMPARINSTVVAQPSAPEVFILGGFRFQPHMMTMSAFQVVYPDRSMIIDTALDQEMVGAKAKFYPEHYGAMQEAMRRASAIVVTHEHSDHIGGIARSQYLEELTGKIVLTREQLSNSRELERSKFPASAAAALKPLDYDHYYPFAPGIVLIKAPGHTPGSQMIYVRLQNGEEYLFVGDIAWHSEQIATPSGRPRLTSRFLSEDRAAVLGQLRTLHELAASERINLVVAHDTEQLEHYVADGKIGASLE